jgi:hypothetical protein
MKNIFLTLLINLCCGYLIGQNNYTIGYNEGFPIGYCYYQGIGCIAPTTPFAPIPTISESYNSYIDGYNRGLLDGLNSFNNKKISTNYKKTTNNFKPYSTPQHIPEFKPFVPDFNFYNNVLTKKQNELNNKTNSNKKQTSDPEFDQLIKEYLSDQNINLRKQYIKLCKTQYNTFTSFPKVIKNGIYNVILINERAIEKSAIIERDCRVIVQNNWVIACAQKDENGNYVWDYYKPYFPNINYKDKQTYISNNTTIVNGKGSYSWKFHNGYKFGSVFAEEFTYDVYFNDFITTYNSAQSLLLEIKKKYESLKVFNKITDGWHVCYLTNNYDLCDLRNVYVENGKITKWVGINSDEILIDSGGEIVNCKTTFSKIWPASTQPEFTNTFYSKPQTHIYDAYFIDL